MMKLPKFLPWLLTSASVIVAFSCSEKDEPAPHVADNLVEAVVSGSRSAAELRLLVELSEKNIDPALFLYDVDVYNVVYTTNYKDAEVNASGLILLPKTANTLPMIGFQRGTIVRQVDAPSLQSKSSPDVISYAALASTGFITVIPDLLGFGESDEIFHPYYVEEPTTTAVIDLLQAAVTLVRENEISFNNRLFLAGYSQGGYATLATHKALESHPIAGFDLIASFSGAGGYDLTAMQDYMFGLEAYASPYYLAYVGIGYEDYYVKNGLLAGLFNEPYASRIPGLFDGVKPTGDINAQLTNDMGGLVRANILDESDESGISDFLSEKFAENSVTDWAPSLPVFLYHGDADLTVPFENSAHTYETLLSNGAVAENLHLISLPGKDHGSAVEPFIEKVIIKLHELR